MWPRLGSSHAFYRKSCHLSFMLRSSKTTEIVARLGWIQELPFESQLLYGLLALTPFIALTNILVIGKCSHYFSHVLANLSLLQSQLLLHPRNLTWNLKINPWKRKVHLQTIIFRFHVKFRGCISEPPRTIMAESNGARSPFPSRSLHC